jgi:hypothetical protein
MVYEDDFDGRKSLDPSTLRGWRYAAFLLFELDQGREFTEIPPKNDRDINGGKRLQRADNHKDESGTEG